ncbi:MAG: glycosyltransferase family 4 protein [Mogibacterium sp.]|nr:glycosyltransferase family 4 protein [Mogibacterium sp.]
MKILSITAQKPHSTGSGTYLTELVRSFDRMGCKQAVVCGIFPDDEVDFPEGVACYPVFFSGKSSSASLLAAPCKAKRPAINALPFPVVGMSDIMPYESTLYRDLTPEMISAFEDAFVKSVSRAIDDLDPDLIICHHLFLLTAIVRKHFPDRRIAGISHGTDLRQMINCDNLREIVRPEIGKLDKIFALHQDQKERISEIFGISEDRITVIGSGYNDKLFNLERRHPREDMKALIDGDVPVMICYAGKMSRPKGVPELLAALRNLAEEPGLPPFEVSLAGGCQDESVMKELENLPSNIRWLGQVPQLRLADIFKYSDIFVLPSYFEGLPLVLIEAMAAGMIPISTDLPGVRPWIEENVPGHNVRFIDMPEMATIDTPTEAGRIKLTEDLTEALRDLIIRIDSGELPDGIPDTSRITWDGVASRILD